jgi:Protein of unknown function (DUF4038)/Putative collagen-binding domain of a collagenase
MFTNHRSRRSLLAWASAAALLSLIFCVIHFRKRIAAAHDAGFSLQVQDQKSSPVQRVPRSIVSAAGQFITLDPTGRFLVNSITNRPVFIVGDSAWSLITQLDNSDVELYLSDRAARGFNFIWCAAADNYYQSTPPKDSYGDSPFDGPDFTHEDARYWAHVDFVLQRAAAHGITVALNPAFVGLTSPGGYLRSYQESSDSSIAAYGEFLGDRYKGYANLIWALGGDVDPETGVLPKLTALANGIRSRDKVHLITAEGQPQHAALDSFGNVNWMDLNWLYFHMTNIPGGAARNYFRSPWTPPFLGEATYENTDSLSAVQIREQGYWAVLSGAYLGHGGFGNSPIWYFNAGPDAQSADPMWKSQLDSAGANGQMHLGELFRSREHWKLVPDVSHAVLIAGYDSRNVCSAAWELLRSAIHRTPYRLGSQSAVAARTSDGQTIIAYVPKGSAATVSIAMNEITDSASEAKCWWFNPRDGLSLSIGVFATSGTRRFTPPDDYDWVLVVDSLSAKLPPPGRGNA